jgi:malate dehydrogenase (oxaloacetate-decarboxylating)(NADP+)
VGARRPRATGDEYAALLDEVVTSARARYGPSLLIDFCNLPHAALDAAFAAHRGSMPCYSDDVQGIGAVVLAGVLAAARATRAALADHTFLFVGEGPAGVRAAELVAECVARGSGGKATVVDARAKVWLADGRGLITRARAREPGFPDFALPYAHDAPCATGLAAAVRAVKPTVLVGVCGGRGGRSSFSREVVCEMAASNDRPIIMALSTPAEVTAADAYEWTGGRALFASAGPATPALTLSDGTSRRPGAAHTGFIFPGLGFGTVASRSTRLRDEAAIAAAEAVAACVTDADLDAGSMFPPLSSLGAVAARVACAVAKRQYDGGSATELPRPADLGKHLEAVAYRPAYRRYR